MRPVSSAAPEDLRAYCLATQAAAANLDAEARRLEAALDALHRRCTEYPVGQAHGLDARLRDSARCLGELAAWAEGVAAAFRQADGGALGGLPGGLSPLGGGTGQAPSPAISDMPGDDAPPALIGSAPPQAVDPLRLIEASIALLHGQHARALLALVLALSADEQKAMLRAVWHGFGKATGVAELLRAFAALDAALDALLPLFRDRAGGHRPHAAALFVFETIWAEVPIPGLHMFQDGPAKDVAWNGLAATLLGLLTAVEARTSLVGRLAVVPPVFDVVLGVNIGATVLGIGALSVGGDVVHWAQQPIRGSDDIAELAQRSFWSQAFPHIEPDLRLTLGARFDALNIRFNLGGHGRDHDSGPRECAPPSSQAPGAYRAISYEPGEQLVLEQLNGSGDYRVSIAGFDPNKPGAPNNATAVMLASDYSPADNHYYHHVRARLFEALRDIPPGSRLHLQGHSLGGAMCLMLWNDPEVRRRLQQAEIVVPSLTTYGAVIPKQVTINPPLPEGDPFAGTAFRAYVHASDSLALNVGAGYAGFDAVQLTGVELIDAPADAHTDYANPERYAGLPPELLELPYVVDPEHYERSIPGLPSQPGPYTPVEAPPSSPGPFA
jgi:hypothetical protein